MAFGTIHVFSSNYEKNDFWALGEEIIKFAKKNGATANLINDNGVRYQTIQIKSLPQLDRLKYGLKTMAVGYALLK